MALTWTAEAEEVLDRAPRILRPLIRRRLEAVAKREQRGAIDLAFVLRVKGQQGPTGSPARPSDERDPRIGEDLVFLAELCEAHCASSHPEGQPAPVPPVGAMAQHLDSAKAPTLCADCRKLFLHVAAKRIVCPHDPKPSCRHCTTPCHHPEFREQMARVMTWNVERPSPLHRD